MSEHNIFMGSKSKSENFRPTDQPKLSFLSNVDDLLQKTPLKKTMKKVNTKVPKQVLTSFLMYCVQENQFRKEVFSEMLRQFLEKPKKQPFVIVDTINGEVINFKEVEGANFEFDLEMFSEVQKCKVVNRLTYIQIYTQVIVQFLENKSVQNK